MEQENKLKHLEFIQGIINRMGQNSFLLKGWTVTLLVGLFALANVKDMDFKFVLIAYIPAVFFWCLDGYFLWNERMFRKLYDDVRGRKPENVDFSMNVSCYHTQTSWKDACFSLSLKLFYIPILIVIFLTMVFTGEIF